jgi:hypothetical protein
MTPLITHAFIIINGWQTLSLTGSTSQVPWHNIRDQTPFRTLLVASTSGTMATPAPALPTVYVALATPTLAQCTPAPVTPLPVEKLKPPMMKPGEGGHKDQKEGPANDGSAKKAAKQPKPSPEEVPAHHLVSEDNAVEEKPKALEPDTLWLHTAECITPRCATCELKAIWCVMTGQHLACVSCHTGKVKCSYSTTCKAKLAASSSEGTSKVAGKRKQENINDDYKASSSWAPKKQQGASTDTATRAPSESPGPIMLASSKFTLLVAGLQVSVSKLHALVKLMEEQMRILASENKMIQGWMETMMIPKDKTLHSPTIPCGLLVYS